MVFIDYQQYCAAFFTTEDTENKKLCVSVVQIIFYAKHRRLEGYLLSFPVITGFGVRQIPVIHACLKLDCGLRRNDDRKKHQKTL